MFKSWADASEFARVHIDPESGTVAWPDGIDLAPDALYRDVAGIKTSQKRAPGFALKAPSGGFISNTARHSRGVNLHVEHHVIDGHCQGLRSEGRYRALPGLKPPEPRPDGLQILRLGNRSFEFQLEGLEEALSGSIPIARHLLESPEGGASCRRIRVLPHG